MDPLLSDFDYLSFNTRVRFQIVRRVSRRRLFAEAHVQARLEIECYFFL